MSHEESYARAFPFDKMIPGLLDPEMMEDTAGIINEAIRDKVRANLIINNRASGNAPLIAQKIADRFRLQRQKGLFELFICRVLPELIIDRPCPKVLSSSHNPE
jgi:hypothetical protein